MNTTHAKLSLLAGLALVSALAMTPAAAPAQNIGLYQLAPSGVVELPSATTNVFVTYVTTNGVWNGAVATNTYGFITGGPNLLTNGLTLPVSDFDNVGLSFGFLPWAGDTNAPVGVQVFRSYDFGRTFEAGPGFSFTNGPTAAGLAQYTLCTNLAMQGVTTLGFNFINAAAAGVVSNLTGTANMKAPKMQMVPAGIYTGPATPTPVITSTNWVP